MLGSKLPFSTHWPFGRHVVARPGSFFMIPPPGGEVVISTVLSKELSVRRQKALANVRSDAPSPLPPQPERLRADEPPATSLVRFLFLQHLRGGAPDVSVLLRNYEGSVCACGGSSFGNIKSCRCVASLRGVLGLHDAATSFDPEPQRRLPKVLTITPGKREPGIVPEVLSSKGCSEADSEVQRGAGSRPSLSRMSACSSAAKRCWSPAEISPREMSWRSTRCLLGLPFPSSL